MPVTAKGAGETSSSPGKNTTDPERRRATYGLRYPQTNFTIATRHDVKQFKKKNSEDERGVAEEYRLTFSLIYGTIEAVVFRNCNFHDKQGRRSARINRVTFRNCVFEHCIMGTTLYNRVHFERCNFIKSDFAYAEFKKCALSDGARRVRPGGRACVRFLAYRTHSKGRSHCRDRRTRRPPRVRVPGRPETRPYAQLARLARASRIAPEVRGPRVLGAARRRHHS